MGIFLTDITALEYWRIDGRAHCGAAPSASFGRARSNAAFRPSAVELSELESRGFSYLSKPIHVLVPDQSMRLHCREAVFHTCSYCLHPNSYVQVSCDLFVAKPELALLSVARHASMPEVVQLCFELCGSYRLLAEGGFRAAEPLATPESLRRFAARSSRMFGAEAVAGASRFALAGSASPMETVAAMLLTLPRRLGGYGLPQPVLNYRVDIPEASRWLTDKSYYVVDLCWPKERVAVEYDSDLYHVGAERIAADAARKNVLFHIGYPVTTICREQIMSARNMDGIAEMLTRRLGLRVRFGSGQWRSRQGELRAAVLPGGGRHA